MASPGSQPQPDGRSCRGDPWLSAGVAEPARPSRVGPARVGGPAFVCPSAFLPQAPSLATPPPPGRRAVHTHPPGHHLWRSREPGRTLEQSPAARAPASGTTRLHGTAPGWTWLEAGCTEGPGGRPTPARSSCPQADAAARCRGDVRPFLPPSGGLRSDRRRWRGRGRGGGGCWWVPG